MYRIGKTFRFEAGHSLPHLPEGHKCKRPHGHSYQVEVVLTAQTLDVTGFVLDYAVLDKFKKWIDQTVDHRNLNEVVTFDTTAENLAGWFYRRVSEIVIQTVSVQIERVTVKETESTFAEYIP